jgi:hypothetical protein
MTNLIRPIRLIRSIGLTMRYRLVASLLVPGLCSAVLADSGLAVSDALEAGKALCKVISPTDAGITGSHQAGLYLPKSAWRFFTASAPVEEENRKEEISITWLDGKTTPAMVNWYGKGTRSEFRLIRLGTSLDKTSVGDLLVMVPLGEGKFHGHWLRTEEEAEAFCNALGIQPGARWGFFEKSVEDFIAAAASLMNRRKSRAGHSLEAHVEYLLAAEGITFEAQALIDGNGRPDILLPGKAAYNDPAHPAEKLVVLGLKTTCRDRWRQVLNEGKRIPQKHLLTLQPAMSRAQLKEMQEAKLQLVVPVSLHAGYDLPEGGRLLSVEQFVKEMRHRFPREQP